MIFKSGGCRDQRLGKVKVPFIPRGIKKFAGDQQFDSNLSCFFVCTCDDVKVFTAGGLIAVGLHH